jgi:hypothetical protein
VIAAALAAVPAEATVVLAESTSVSALQTNAYLFSAPGAGTLDVQLDDLDFSAPLDTLMASVNSPSAVLGSLSLPNDNLLISINGPLQLSAFVTAQAGGPLDLGAYSLEVTFTAAGTPVPLPAAGLLLGGGAGLLGSIGWRWRRRADTHPEVPVRNESVMCAV